MARSPVHLIKPCHFLWRSVVRSFPPPPPKKSHDTFCPPFGRFPTPYIFPGAGCQPRRFGGKRKGNNYTPARKDYIPSRPKLSLTNLCKVVVSGQLCSHILQNNHFTKQIPSHILLQTVINEWKQHCKENVLVELFL